LISLKVPFQKIHRRLFGFFSLFQSILTSYAHNDHSEVTFESTNSCASLGRVFQNTPLNIVLIPFPHYPFIKMEQYPIGEGQEDRHGEMTGAISVNMILSTIPVGLWCFFLGPWLTNFTVTLSLGLLMGIVLPLALLPLSRRIWTVLSRWADRM